MNNASTLKYMRALADSYESIQSVRIEGENRTRAIVQQYDEEEPVRLGIMQRLIDLKEIEKDLQKDMTHTLRELPIWNDWFKHVKGIGMTLACKLLALELDPDRNFSSWTAYFGLISEYNKGTCAKGHKRLYAKDPLFCQVFITEEDKKDRHMCNEPIASKERIEKKAPKLEKGYNVFWNPRARELSYLIGTSFVKLGRFYREQYDHFKARENQNRPDISDLQKHNSAMRKSVQLFLAHTYQATHELRGTTARLPYQYEYLNHNVQETMIPWQDVVAYDSVKKKKVVNE